MLVTRVVKRHHIIKMMKHNYILYIYYILILLGLGLRHDLISGLDIPESCS